MSRSSIFFVNHHGLYTDDFCSNTLTLCTYLFKMAVGTISVLGHKFNLSPYPIWDTQVIGHNLMQSLTKVAVLPVRILLGPAEI